MTPRSLDPAASRTSCLPRRDSVGRALFAALALMASILFGASPTRVAWAEGDAEEEAAAGGARPLLDGACEQGRAVDAAARIQARYDHIRDISGEFVQESRSATFGGDPLMSPEPRRGRVVLAKPGRMRWTYETPEASEVVSDGRTLWIHDVEAATVTRLEVTDGFLSGAALQFLMGDGRILEAFDVEARACEKDRVHLVLVPKQDASYERLELVATGAGDILATAVIDLFGNETWIRFDAVRVNVGPDPDAFELAIPEGVEVIEYAPTKTP